MKDFILYYLFKMQPNALLIQQNFIVVKSGCYKPTPPTLKESRPPERGSALE
jgi:hypothetical protein